VDFDPLTRDVTVIDPVNEGQELIKVTAQIDSEHFVETELILEPQVIPCGSTDFFELDENGIITGYNEEFVAM
jgi:hypothetical protein